MIRTFRIHGDNIIECERTLRIISKAFRTCPLLKTTSAIYKPLYVLEYGHDIFEIELLAGLERWGTSINSILSGHGAPLKEDSDSYITEIKDDKEEILFAIEYCSALPAGNNAWQRNGRAYSCILAGVPYIYYAELGGAELDVNRNMKSARIPNPIVPFSYVSASHRVGSDCIPVFRPHPSISSTLYSLFKDTFGMEESEELIKNILLGIDPSKPKSRLFGKSMNLVLALSSRRTRKDTLKGEQWVGLYNTANACKWLTEKENYLVWNKTFAEKVKVTHEFRQFKNAVMSLKLASIGAAEIPVCIVPHTKIQQFNRLLHRFYPSITHDFDKDKDLAVVWIAGYKPRGDDSRPDRGLTSLARMVLGQETVLLSIVYGPAKARTYDTVSGLVGIESNGMWASVAELSDFAIFDSINYPRPVFHELRNRRKANHQPVIFPYRKADLNGTYGEHDIDSTLHQIFGNDRTDGIKECFCNPPGGDWSGIS